MSYLVYKCIVCNVEYLRIERMKTKPSTAPSGGSQSPSKEEKPEIDFTKEWSNGHKFFNTPQQRAFTELLHAEERTRVVYDDVRDKLTKPRNPLNGEPSPRDARGIIVLNPRLLHTVHSGVPLFNKDLPPSHQKTFRNDLPIMGKIGVADGKYDVLGNTLKAGETPSSSTGGLDLFKSTQLLIEKKKQMKEEREKVSEFIATEKAKRYEKELQRQMLVLQRKMEEKNREMNVLRNTYNNTYK